MANHEFESSLTVSPMTSEYRQGRDQYKKDTLYAGQVVGDLVKANPNTFIGIYGEKVVAISSDLDVLIDMIRASGVNPSAAHIRFLSDKKRTQFPG